MTAKAIEKIIDALTELMDGYLDLQANVSEELGEGVKVTKGEEKEVKEKEDDEETESELRAALLTEMRAAIESVIENEDYSTEELASLVSMITEALEEIDPDIFAEQGVEVIDEYDDDEEDYDLDDEEEDLDEEEE